MFALKRKKKVRNGRFNDEVGKLRLFHQTNEQMKFHSNPKIRITQ